MSEVGKQDFQQWYYCDGGSAKRFDLLGVRVHSPCELLYLHVIIANHITKAFDWFIIANRIHMLNLTNCHVYIGAGPPPVLSRKISAEEGQSKALLST